MDSVFLYFAETPARDITAALLSIRADEFLLPEFGASIAKRGEPIVVRTDESRLNCWVIIEVEDYRGRDPLVRVQMREDETATEVELLAHHDFQESRLALEIAILLLRQYSGAFEDIHGNLSTLAEIEAIARNKRATVYNLQPS